MKALIGIDLEERWQAALDLFVRLRFTDPEATLVHSLEWHSPGGFIPPVQVEAERYRHRLDAAKQACAAAAERLSDVGIPARIITEDGDPVRSLIHHADELAVDVIVAGSTAKGTFGSLFFGSVGKGLTIGAHRSLLFGKRRIEHDGPLTAVLATDHSPYIGRCLERLLALGPRGIRRLIVMTADEDAGACAELASKNDQTCRQLAALAVQCEGRVVEADPVAAIHAAMTGTGADLLILGAQGHGFVERHTVGSVSLYEVIAEPFNTLILRGP